VSAAPWSVKGIDPKAREVAKDLARRSGMTLGEWLNTMIMDDVNDEEDVVPLNRRPHASDAFERRGRSRRLDDLYTDSGDTLHRVAASVDAIAARLEAAERRSTVAIQGVDQAVNGLVRRLDGQEHVGRTFGRRIDEIAEELREGHRRLRQFEQDTGPKTTETFAKVEAGLGGLAARLYDIEERQRNSFNELRERMEAAERGAGPGPGTDLMAQASARLDQAQSETTAALRGLERSFADLDQRLRAAETRAEPEGLREAARFEKLAETLTRQVETSRADMMRRIDTAEQENRLSRIEAAVSAAGEQIRAAEERSARDIETMGREVVRIAQNFSGRVDSMEGRVNQVESATLEKVSAIGKAIATDLSHSLNERLEREITRHSQSVDQRLTRAEDQNAIALERLGDEITRISDRLSDRIAQSERKSAQALDDVARRLGDSSERIDQVYGRVSGEMAERLRLSEERTAALIDQARESIERRAMRSAESPAASSDRAHTATSAPQPDFRQPDWRAAAFPDENFDSQDLWSAPAADGKGPSPFPAFDTAPPPVPSRSVAETLPSSRIEADLVDEWDEPAVQSPATVSAFGGADVSDALAATSAGSPFATQAFASSAHDAGDHDPLAGDYVTADAGGYSHNAEVVDVHALRAGLSLGATNARADSTRGAIDAARAAMAALPDETPEPRGAFGIKRGGKSRLQERLDKQARRESSTMKKTLLASVTATALVGAFFFTGRLTGVDVLSIPALERVLGLGSAEAPASPAPETGPDTPLVAVALTAAEPSPEAQALFDKAILQIEEGKPGGLDTLTQAANLGLPLAQLKLADLYQSGTAGATRNLTEARAWARRAAEAGDPRGMHAFGMYLFDAVGGARNRPEALNWLVRAAERGLVDSQFNVAKIYEAGDEGIAANPADALKWYLIAAKAGDQQARAAADRLSTKVPSAARRSAREAAEAFKAEPVGAAGG